MRWRTRKLVALSILWWEVSWVFILDFIKAYINIFKIGETNSPFVFILKIRTSTNQRSTKKTCTSVISTSCVTCISKQRTSQVPEIFNGISFRVCTWELNKCNKKKCKIWPSLFASVQILIQLECKKVSFMPVWDTDLSYCCFMTAQDNDASSRREDAIAV